MQPEMPAGSSKPMRPDPCVRGPVPSSSPTCSGLLAGPPLPLGPPWRSHGRDPWISEYLGRHSGRTSW